jgi:hypothetical protein
MRNLAETVDRLCAASRTQYRNPYTDLDWPVSLDKDDWHMSPELVSLYGTAAHDALSEAERKRLSLFETVNFFSLNIHGEKALVEGMARRLYAPGCRVISSYLHHFVDEENKHMINFGEFCLRYAGKVYADRKITVPREHAPGEEEFLFFAKILIFEEVVDHYNARMARDIRLPRIIREINRLHHRDEARHLVFGRKLVKELFEHYAPRWPDETLKGVRRYLADYLAATEREYCNPDVYRDAGVADPFAAREEALRDPGRRAHWREVTRACRGYLREIGVLRDEVRP